MRVQVRDLEWVRGGKTLVRIPRLDLEGPGLVIVTGASGAGKSSLLKALTGTLREFQGGDIRGSVDLRHNEERPVKIGFVPQDARDGFLAHDPLTEFQLRLQADGFTYKAAREEAFRLLRRYELESRAQVPVHRLSAGERRRLALLAARTHRPDLLLLDEPLNHLDHEWRDVIVNEVSGFAESSLVIIATHEPDPWLAVAERHLEVDKGSVHPMPTIRPADRRSWSRPPVQSVERMLVASGIKDRLGLFEGLELRVGNGLHAIIGPNGTGKSTLLRILGGLERPGSGTVAFDGKDVSALPPGELARFRAHHIEEPSETFFMDRGRDEIAFQPTNAGIPTTDVEKQVEAATTIFELADKIDRHPLSLSGGEQERLALACLHAADADLILLDEPTHGLDESGRNALVEFLGHASQRSCVVLATHDERLIQHCDTVCRIQGRRLVPVSTRETLPEVRPRAP